MPHPLVLAVSHSVQASLTSMTAAPKRLHSTLPLWQAILCLFALLMSTASATAQTPDVNSSVPVVAVIAYEGPQGQRFHRASIKALSEGPWRDRMTLTTGEDATVFIYGSTRKSRRKITLTLTVSSVTDEDTLAEVSFSGTPRGLTKTIASKLPTSLIDGIEAAHIRTQTAIAYEKEQNISATPELLAVKSRPAPEVPAANPDSTYDALIIKVAAQIFSRELSYKDDIYQQLYGYRLPLGPAINTDAEWYPAADSGGAFGHVGLLASARLAVGINSDGDTSHSTSAWGAQAGLRGRIPLGMLELGLIGAYGVDSFSFEDSEQGVEAPAPDTSYNFARIGFDGHLNFADLTISSGWSYRVVLSSGEISEADWFPRAEASGAEAHFSIGYEITPLLDVGLELDWRRYAFSMNPEQEDTLVAGGALDETIAGALFIGWRL